MDRPGLLHQLQNPAPITLVAPLQDNGLKIQGLGEPGHASRAHAPTPTVDPQGLSWALAAPLLKGLAKARQFRPHQVKPQLNRRGPTHLLVGRADLSALIVAEERQVLGARDVPLFKFGGSTDVHDGAFALKESLDGLPVSHDVDPCGALSR